MTSVAFLLKWKEGGGEKRGNGEARESKWRRSNGRKGEETVVLGKGALVRVLRQFYAQVKCSPFRSKCRAAYRWSANNAF